MWRCVVVASRSGRLRSAGVAVLCVLAFVNVLLPRQHHTTATPPNHRTAARRYQATAPQHRSEAPSQGAVRDQLTLGALEDENSAREVLDDGDATPSGISVRGQAAAPALDANAANEIHSGEAKDDGVKENEDVELSFHQLPQHQQEGDPQHPRGQRESQQIQGQTLGAWRNLSNAEVGRLSVLGRRMFLQEVVGSQRPRNFTILVWQTGPQVERRFLRQYGKEKKDPFAQCSVANCRLTYDDAAASTADAILFHLHRTNGPDSFPRRGSPSQRWVFLSDESPPNTFLLAKDKTAAHYDGYFNWSMSYRMDSDVPVPYGRTLVLPSPATATKDFFSTKAKGVAIMGSNCGGANKRWSYVKELQRHVDVDVYGKCGNLTCPGHYAKDCPSLEHYKFYLAFENGNCVQYITEKVWWNALGKGAVPVVMGGPVEYYRQLLPPHSFLHVDQFDTPRQLAQLLISLSHDREAYNKYHAWRSHYTIRNEHGYFGSPVYHYCRLCEALNYNDPTPKVYKRFKDYWNNAQCQSPKWEEKMKKAEKLKMAMT